MSKVETSAPAAPSRPRVSIAFLQAPVTLPGLFTSETTLSAAKHPALKVELTELGLLLTHGDVRAIVPMTNVKIAVLK